MEFYKTLGFTSHPFVKTNADANIKINEYMERKYIFITYPDGNLIQYTANRI